MKILSKDVFCKAMREMERLRRLEDSVNDLFRDEGVDFMEFSYCAYESLLFEVLEDIFDKESTLCYWIYDLDFGTEYEYPDGLRQYDEHGNVVPLRTAEELYDYLAKNT